VLSVQEAIGFGASLASGTLERLVWFLEVTSASFYQPACRLNLLYFSKRDDTSKMTSSFERGFCLTL